MHLPEEPVAQRQLPEQLPATVQGRDAVDDLTDVKVRNGCAAVELEGEDVVERALGTFDLRAEECLLPDLRDPSSSSRSRPLFETFVMGELRRALGWAQGSVALFHFRTRDGVEVDIVCEDDNRNVAGIEVKASASITLSDFRGLTLLRDKLGDRFTPPVFEPPTGERLQARWFAWN